MEYDIIQMSNGVTMEGVNVDIVKTKSNDSYRNIIYPKPEPEEIQQILNYRDRQKVIYNRWYNKLIRKYRSYKTGLIIKFTTRARNRIKVDLDQIRKELEK